MISRCEGNLPVVSCRRLKACPFPLRELRLDPRSDVCKSLEPGASGSSVGSFFGLGASLGPYGLGIGVEAGLILMVLVLRTEKIPISLKGLTELVLLGSVLAELLGSKF